MYSKLITVAQRLRIIIIYTKVFKPVSSQGSKKEIRKKKKKEIKDVHTSVLPLQWDLKLHTLTYVTDTVSVLALATESGTVCQ